MIYSQGNMNGTKKRRGRITEYEIRYPKHGDDRYGGQSITIPEADAEDIIGLLRMMLFLKENSLADYNALMARDVAVMKERAA